MASSTLINQTLIDSINVDDLLNNIYSGDDGDSPATTTADVWCEIATAGRSPEMTLEHFLTKAGAVAPGEVAEERYGGGGRRRKGLVSAEEFPMDRVTQKRQKRMIKNRESAARSRERKQAYTVELEALVMQLEEDNSRLVREGAERSRKRFKKLMKNLIPVGEKERPPRRAHRRVHSVGW